LSIDVTVQVLKENIGKNIVIKLKGDKVVKGILEKFDQHMNLVLSEATEYKAEEATKLGNLLLKGDNIIISPQEYKKYFLFFFAMIMKLIFLSVLFIGAWTLVFISCYT
jgi:small nuclear ribonucleoprotein